MPQNAMHQKKIAFNDLYTNKKPNSPWPNLANGITKIKGYPLTLVYNIVPTGTELSKISNKRNLRSSALDSPYQYKMLTVLSSFLYLMISENIHTSLSKTSIWYLFHKSLEIFCYNPHPIVVAG